MEDVRAFEYRFASDGTMLHTIGMIVDSSSGLNMEHVSAREVHVGSGAVEIVEGVYDDRWHVVVIRRSTIEREEHEDRTPIEIATLHRLGVRQVLSAGFADFDGPGFADCLGVDRSIAAMFIDLSDAPELSAGLGASSCTRLLAATTAVLEATDIEILPEHMQEHLVGMSNQERGKAESFGMCYAAIDMQRPASSNRELELHEFNTDLLQRALAEISPLSSCSCAERVKH